MYVGMLGLGAVFALILFAFGTTPQGARYDLPVLFALVLWFNMTAPDGVVMRHRGVVPTGGDGWGDGGTCDRRHCPVLVRRRCRRRGLPDRVRRDVRGLGRHVPKSRSAKPDPEPDERPDAQ